MFTRKQYRRRDAIISRMDTDIRFGHCLPLRARRISSQILHHLISYSATPRCPMAAFERYPARSRSYLFYFRSIISERVKFHTVCCGKVMEVRLSDDAVMTSNNKTARQFPTSQADVCTSVSNSNNDRRGSLMACPNRLGKTAKRLLKRI